MSLGARLARLEALEVDTAITQYARVLASVVRGADLDDLQLTVAAQDTYERGETPTAEQEAAHTKLQCPGCGAWGRCCVRAGCCGDR
jgi:hypothetical protein